MATERKGRGAGGRSPAKNVASVRKATTKDRKRASGSSRRRADRVGLAEVAGMRDEAVFERTGKDWAAWVEIFDRAGAESMSHRNIARWVQETHSVSGWWAQTLTVGYERIKGRRAVGQRSDGSFAAQKTKTFARPASELYRLFRSSRQRSAWWDGPEVSVTSARPNEALRWTLADGTRVVLGFGERNEGKTTVTVRHEKLASEAEVGRAKEAWAARFARLGAGADRVVDRSSGDPG